MAHRRLKQLLAAALAALPCLASAAAPFRYALDAQRSDVSAKVTVFAISSMTAHFPGMSGNILLAPDHLDATEIDVTLDARALTTGDDSTRQQLTGPDFFDVAQFPQIHFAGSRLVMTGERTARIFGDLTARGVNQPVVLNVLFDRPPAEATGTTPIAISASMKIDRDLFGMTAMHGIVSRTVTIEINATMAPL